MDKIEKVFYKHILDLADAATRKGIVLFTDFMNLNQLNIFHIAMQKLPYIQWNTFGGYESAERQMAAFIPDALYYEWSFPVSCLEIKPLNFKFSEKLTHRDYLGAILNLGIERSTLGDILIEENRACVFCHDHMADLISEELTRVKHTSINTKKIDLSTFTFSISTESVKGTVASIRLDSILSVAFHTSRSSLAGLIEAGKVLVNGRVILSNGYSVKDNDVISVRGYGKFRYCGISSTTKKGRFCIDIERYRLPES